MGIVAFTLLFVTAVSIDSFGIGCVIGMKQLQISLKSVVGIALLSGVCFLLSAYFGQFLLHFVSVDYAEQIGACALIGIGIYFLWQFIRKPKEDLADGDAWFQPARVLNDPESADVDDSGGIKGKEVWLLGIALSLDTIGAGVSGAFIGVSPLLTGALIAMATCLMLIGGLISGNKLGNKADHLSVLPGILLIIIGVIKLL